MTEVGWRKSRGWNGREELEEKGNEGDKREDEVKGKKE